jgi:hypothetical protein
MFRMVIKFAKKSDNFALALCVNQTVGGNHKKIIEDEKKYQKQERI